MIEVHHQILHDKKIHDFTHTWFVTSFGSRMSPNTNLESQANYWALLLKNGYSSSHDQETNILRFWKDDEIITIDLKSVDKNQRS